MTRKILLTLVVAVMVAFAVPQGANATYIDFASGSYIDLSDSTTHLWSELELTPQTMIHAQVGDLTFTITAETGYWTSSDGGEWNDTGDGNLLWDYWRGASGDAGLGVGEINPQAYEVAETEAIHIVFDNPVYITGFDLSLFYVEGGSGDTYGYQETGWYSTSPLNEDDWNLMVADALIRGSDPYDYYGQYHQTVDSGAKVTELWLVGGKGQSLTEDPDNSEFKLTGVSASNTPEPGTMILFGSAAGIIGLVRRRKSLKKRA